MEPILEEERDQFLTTFQREAVHLEMRDVYATNIEKNRFQAWLRGESLDPGAEVDWWRPWFEWLDAAQLVSAGEDVRWLPRRNTSKLLLPGNDFWMFDRRTVAFTHFSGDGHVLDHQVSTDPEVVEACSEAFEEAWKIAIPHDEYTPS